MDIFQVLSNDERIIVLSTADCRQVYTWDQSARLLTCWDVDETGQFSELQDMILDRSSNWNFREVRELAQTWYLKSQED